MSINQDDFRGALSRFASGVTVVTTQDAAKTPCGLTVSAFSSLSLDPPLVSVCINRSSSSLSAFSESGVFAVNILSEDQEQISRRFASRVPDRFEGVDYRIGDRGAPVLEGALANLECRIVQFYDGGDHTILIGRVESARITDGRPLLYYRGGYAALG